MIDRLLSDMAGSGRWRWLAVVMLVVVSVSEPAFSDPQTNQVDKGCSQTNVTNAAADYAKELNASFSDLRRQLSRSNKSFATTSTAIATAHPIYALAQCRNYLSNPDCVACFDAAVSVARNCSLATGARVTLDGCFLRYDSALFYAQITDNGSHPICGKGSAGKQDVFNTTAKQLLKDLVFATPKIGFFAAAKRVSAGGATAAYAVTQCIETLDENSCLAYLSIAYINIQTCLPISSVGRAVGIGCFMRYSDKHFFAINYQTTEPAYSIMWPGNIISSPGSSGKKKSSLAGVVGGVGIIFALAAIFLFYSQSKKPKAARRGDILGTENYRYKDLKAATKAFSEENKLGKGGFGDVYKGTLMNGDVVAVKKLAMIYSRAKVDFNTEVRLITNVRHRNLIRLLGCSANGEELLLVYEYMANASLERYIYGDKRGMLNWKQRVDIIFGTARGLSYLHDICIIHRDIKSSNILLDDDFHPKIADFGLARLLSENQSHVSTKFAGTLGYTAPEYAIHGHLSEKVDIYSFGIVILEIISGRRSSDIRVEPVTEYLLEQALKLYENEEYLELVDKTLEANEYKVEEMKRMLEIAMVCTQSPPVLGQAWRKW
uniref:Protein kinase n=1 Tax=Ipomoea nil TaxID=35883 RepID=A9CM11_IPONI|nr:protein kinase [Ipomoea nil]